MRALVPALPSPARAAAVAPALAVDPTAATSEPSASPATRTPARTAPGRQPWVKKAATTTTTVTIRADLVPDS